MMQGERGVWGGELRAHAERKKKKEQEGQTPVSLREKALLSSYCVSLMPRT